MPWSSKRWLMLLQSLTLKTNSPYLTLANGSCGAKTSPLIKISLPKEFWDFALLVNCFLYKRNHSQVLSRRSSLELLYIWSYSSRVQCLESFWVKLSTFLVLELIRKTNYPQDQRRVSSLGIHRGKRVTCVTIQLNTISIHPGMFGLLGVTSPWTVYSAKWWWLLLVQSKLNPSRYEEVGTASAPVGSQLSQSLNSTDVNFN